MKHLINDLKKMVKTNEKSISALLMYISCMPSGDSFITPVGKINKLDNNLFKIVIDDDVIDKASSIVIGNDFGF